MDASIIQELLNGITLSAVYVAIALGLTITYGILKILHIAHAGVYVWGAYIGYLGYVSTGSVIISLIVASLGAAIIGVAIERLFYMPALDKPPHITLILSIALFLLMGELAAKIFGYHPKGFTIHWPVYTWEIGGVVINSMQLFFLGVVYGASIAVWLWATKTRMGLASRALIQDMEIAKSMGVNVKRVIDINFLLGSALAGLSGVLVGMYYTMIWPHMGDVVAYKGLVVIVLGGFGSIIGAMAGGLILGISESYLIAYLGNVLPRDAFAFLIMIIILILRPQGLFGRSE